MKKTSFAIKIVLFLLLISSFSSCKNREFKSYHTVDLADSFQWAPYNNESHTTVLETAEFKPLTRMGNQNLSDITGKDGAYIWLRADFNVPPLLTGEDLGLSISFLRFAEKLWLNDTYCGSYGEFPPHENSAKYVSHYYLLPENALRKDSKNTILIKVWCHGNSEIGGKIFIGRATPVKHFSDMETFFHSRIYISFEGGMFCATILFLIMFILHKHKREYLYFVLMNLCTMSLYHFFFAPDYPSPTFQSLSYFTFTQLVLFLPITGILFFSTSFALAFIRSRQSKAIRAYRYVNLIICIILIIEPENFTQLYKIFPVFMAVAFAQTIPLWFRAIRRLVLRKNTHNIKVLFINLSPIFIGLLLDVALRKFFPNMNTPFISLFTWQLTIIGFVFILAKRFVRMAKENEFLNQNLQNEVYEQTQELSKVNQLLEAQLERDQMDLRTAELIQKKYFAPPATKFKGWDIASCYEPAAQVSGDLFDYYGFADMLEGFSIFDVSGHGIGAGLITMLSKDIIYQTYKDGLYHSYFTSKIMTEINRKFINTKGDIENYLTGILFTIGNFDEKDACKIQMTNAGHPHPILWSQEEQTVRELCYDGEQKQYGAIGIQNIDVSFNDINFVMKQHDILICYTDGLTEAVNINNEQFGKERVMEIIKQNADKTACEIMNIIKKQVISFSEGRVQDDDLTILVLKRDDSTAPYEFEEELSAEDF